MRPLLAEELTKWGEVYRLITRFFAKPGVHLKTYSQAALSLQVDDLRLLNSLRTLVNGSSAFKEMTMSFTLPATDHFRKLSKKLLKAFEAGDPATTTLVRNVFPGRETISLMNAQHAIAQKYGFRSWSDLEAASPVEQRLTLTMERHPDLSSAGWGVHASREQEMTPDERAEHGLAIFLEARGELRENWRAVEVTCHWIQKNMAPIKTFNRDSTSYGLKHRAEKDIGYITNGVFITAALLMGYKYKVDERSLNVQFNMSKKNINAVYKRQNESQGEYAESLMTDCIVPLWTEDHT